MNRDLRHPIRAGDAPAWLLLAAIVFAPWAYGCTTPETSALLTWLTGACVVGWIGVLIMQRAWPEVHPLLVALTVMCLVQGWWMIANAHYRYDYADGRFVEIQPLIAWAPGVIDRYHSIPMMLRLSALLGIICFVSDLSQSPVWRLRLWRVMAFTGVSIVILGLVQRTLGAEMIFFAPKAEQFPPAVYDNNVVRYYLFFATYYYHANAGAFINLVLPLIGALAAIAVQRRKLAGERALWLSSFVLSIAAAITTASKAAMIVTAIVCLLLGLRLRSFLARLWKSSAFPLKIAAVVTICGISYAAVSVGWTAAALRWSETAAVEDSGGQRLLAAKIGWRMTADSGWWGFGPGNFAIAFPHYTNDLGTAIAGVWDHAHQDYLQLLLEWGWIGAFLWSCIICGGLIIGVVLTPRKHRTLTPGSRTLLAASMIALGGVLLHALVDFPLQIASLQFYAALHLGMAWGSRYWDR